MIKLMQNICGDNILSIEIDNKSVLYLVIFFPVYVVTSINNVGTFDNPNFERINLLINLQCYDSYKWSIINEKCYSIPECFYIIKTDINIMRKIKLMKIND
jgi:hypothetical protein